MENVLNRYYDKNGYLKVVLTPEGKDELQVAWNNGDMDFEVKCWYYINDEEYWVKNDFNFFCVVFGSFYLRIIIWHNDYNSGFYRVLGRFVLNLGQQNHVFA